MQTPVSRCTCPPDQRNAIECRCGAWTAEIKRRRIVAKLELTEMELAIILASLELTTTRLPGNSTVLSTTYTLRDMVNGQTDGNTFLVSERIRSLIY